MGKLGRNEPCWCGSGKKFKKCHWPDTGPSIDHDRITEVFGSFGTSPLEQTVRQRPCKDPMTILARIRDQKRKGTRSVPSSKLISIGDVPTLAERAFLIDTCARLVDQNSAGRSDMCIYFAVLLGHGLDLLGYSATVEVGKARYSMAGQSWRWDHAWVRTQSGDIVDGNVDSMVENPMIPVGIEPKPYWGPPDALPSDREFHKVRDLLPERDDIELDAKVIRRWKTDLARAIKEWNRG